MTVEEALRTALRADEILEDASFAHFSANHHFDQFFWDIVTTAADIVREANDSVDPDELYDEIHDTLAIYATVTIKVGDQSFEIKNRYNKETEDYEIVIEEVK